MEWRFICSGSLVSDHVKMTPEERIAAKGSPRLSDEAAFGVKAVGLARLDGSWTPDFFAIEVGIYQNLYDTGFISAISAKLTSLGYCPDGVLIRSSAAGETLEKRGAFDSERAEATAVAVIDRIRTMTEAVESQDCPHLGFVVQRWLSGAATGHLSNERRVSREARGWLCEVELPIEGEDKSFRFRVDSRTRGREDLMCASWEELAAVLRTVARRMHKGGERFHLEWVWDSERVWIVQCDMEEPESGTPPGSAWRVHNAIPLGDLIHFRSVPANASPFPKIEHVRVFRECALPSGDIRVLSGAKIIERLAHGALSNALRHDLRELIKAPIVVRTDFRASRECPELLSRRTDTCSTLEQLESFLVDVAKAAIDGGCPPRDLAFIAHRFMLARACAMSFGRVGSSRVRIDATWGIPDGLLFYPHDSFAVDVDTGNVDRYLRCKTDFIDVAEDGSWRARAAGSDWDWRPSLTEEEASRIAAMTVAVTDHVGKDLEVMFFVGGDGATDSVIPWFFGASGREVADVQAATGYYVGERVTITNPADLAALDHRQSSSLGRVIILLRPTIELLRSRDFLREVASVAKHRRLPIELEGSQLSHAYYLLEDAGVAIRCRNPWRTPDRRRSFGKLVRDFVPVKIQRRGELASTYAADRAELGELVKAKVIEEAFEYYWSEDNLAEIEELADLFELLRTAARVHGVDFDVVIERAETKLAERGGFEGGVVLVETRASEPRTRQLVNVPTSSHSRRPAQSRRRVLRLPGGRLLLPVAPPTGWHMGQAQTLGFTAESEVTLSYGAAEILVHIHEREAAGSRDQLSLFDDGRLDVKAD
jgi:predicted house-cleaning noncanonical NTP pyrophosphatase (MazG superfamily)